MRDWQDGRSPTEFFSDRPAKLQGRARKSNRRQSFANARLALYRDAAFPLPMVTTLAKWCSLPHHGRSKVTSPISNRTPVKAGIPSEWRGTQAVRGRSAKPFMAGSIPARASTLSLVRYPFPAAASVTAHGWEKERGEIVVGSR